MYDYLVVGAGLFGSTFAYQAKLKHKKILIVEKRNHIAGNVYTSMLDNIIVHEYGAHIFHTDSKMVWDFVNAFSKFNNFINSPKANFKGSLYSLPFNMNTFKEIWGITDVEEAKKKINQQRQAAGIKEPHNLEEMAISLVGTDIYYLLIKGYTEKQWGKACKDLPALIIKRLPLRFVYDNNYYDSTYQGIPINGYTKMVEEMLKGIDVELKMDYLENRRELNALAEKIIYTGPIDAYFNYSLGNLDYRSLIFEKKVLQTSNFQSEAVINYTDAEVPWTRIIEHKLFMPDNVSTEDKTIITKEYPIHWSMGKEPYYPINDDKNNQLYNSYYALAKDEPNTIFGGRLGEYKYYDMDQVILSALTLSKKLLG